MALTKITNSLVAENAIQGTLIADNAITAVHIVNNAITATQLADNAVTATKIQNGIIATDHLAADLITAAKIADDAISEEHLDVTVISSLSAVTANSSDYVMIGDASDSNNLKKVLVSDLQQTDEEIADIVGAMVSSNTESGITVAYQDGDNTLDFTVGTLNQNTTGTAATVTTAAQPNITSTGTLTSFRSTGIDDNADALAMTITSDENLYIGQTASSGVRGSDNRVQISGTSLATSSLILHRYAANAYGPGLGFAKSRHGTIGSQTIVQDDDILGFLSFYGSDGDDFVSHAAEISCQVDGTPGSNDTPGRLTFSTTADGAASATERMRIDSTGKVNITGTISEDNIPTRSRAIAMAMIFG